MSKLVFLYVVFIWVQTSNDSYDVTLQITLPSVDNVHLEGWTQPNPIQHQLVQENQIRNNYRCERGMLVGYRTANITFLGSSWIEQHHFSMSVIVYLNKIHWADHIICKNTLWLIPSLLSNLIRTVQTYLNFRGPEFSKLTSIWGLQLFYRDDSYKHDLSQQGYCQMYDSNHWKCYGMI